MKTLILKVEMVDNNLLNPIEILEIVGGLKATEVQLPTDEEIEEYAIINVLDEDSLEGFEDVRKFQEGAKWLKSKILKP